MNADSQRAKSIFLNAAEITSPTEREAYLAATCGNDATLRHEVDDLLQHHAQAGTFLEPPTLDPHATGDFASEATPPESNMGEQPGMRLGRYKLLQQLGQGGMGSVWMAEQTEPIVRKVALKIIKAGMNSAQVIARFEQERQALALMDHPNIAKVLDAGQAASGQPYFVMELVKGIPITKYCDQEHLTPKERLELFIPVCQAVQHAHQKGII